MWVHNLSCEEAQYLDTWQTSDAGIQNLVEALFKMPVQTVAAALQVDLKAAQVSHIFLLFAPSFPFITLQTHMQCRAFPIPALASLCPALR